MIVLGGSSCQVLAKEVADDLGCELGNLTTKRFPDGELYLRINSDVRGDDLVVIQSISRPQDSSMVELLILLETLKDLGAGKTITVVPYYGYGRQDKRFNDGEAISARVVAKHIQLDSDVFYTINVHEKHIMDFFDIPTRELDASALLGDYFKMHDLEDPVVMAPDIGAMALAKGIAEYVGCDCDYLEKKRLRPGEVETKPKTLDVKDKDVILVDDMIDSGGTMIEAIKLLKSQNAGNVLVGCIHPVLTGSTISNLFASGAVDVVATNTLPSQISFITVSPLISMALKKL